MLFSFPPVSSPCAYKIQQISNHGGVVRTRIEVLMMLDLEQGGREYVLGEYVLGLIWL